MNTIAQQISDTLKRPAPNHEATIPTVNAKNPDTVLCVALKIAGKVITANVAYGT